MLNNKSNTAREMGLKAEQPIISRSVPKLVSCLKQQQEREGERRQLQQVQTRAAKKLSNCSEVFVQSCGKVWVFNPPTRKSVGVKTPTSPTGAPPLTAVSLRREVPTYFTIHYAVAVVQPGIPIPPPWEKSLFVLSGS